MAGAVIAIGVDMLTVAAAYFVLPQLSRAFAEPSPANLALVGGAYVLMCGGVLLGRIAARPLAADRPAGAPPPPARIKSGCSAWFALPFALFVIAMLMQSSGALDEHTHFGRLFLGESGTGGMLVPVFILGFIVVLLAFPLVALLPLRPRLRRSTQLHYLALLAATAAINAMVLVTAAYWESQLADATPMNIGIGGKLLLFAASYMVFLLFYAPPRMALAEVAGGNAARLSFLVLLGVYVWQLLG